MSQERPTKRRNVSTPTPLPSQLSSQLSNANQARASLEPAREPTPSQVSIEGASANPTLLPTPRGSIEGQSRATPSQGEGQSRATPSQGQLLERQTQGSRIGRGPPIVPCASVDDYEKLNRIDEGSYGIVYRGRHKLTGQIVALKKLKLQKEVRGFPVTALREIMSLKSCRHHHVVKILEVVVTPSGSNVFIVMEFIEHDLKGLMEQMTLPFLLSEVKTLLSQLLDATACMHRNWIYHRDLKTSNLLINNRGQIKVADFGLARSVGEPLMGQLTQLVVTLWYRSPELLLGETKYTSAIDMWSIGCIFGESILTLGELILNEPMFPGKGELDQLTQIFTLLGSPNPLVWPSYSSLPYASTMKIQSRAGKGLFSLFPYLTRAGYDLMSRLLHYDPQKRISAQEALEHPFFTESPLPKDPDLFPSFPSKSAGESVRRHDSPSAPLAHHGPDDDQVEKSTFKLRY